ncbi:MAG: EAL domain-containing protein [Sphingomonadaceae bacterium]
MQLSRHIASRALAGAKDWPEHLRLSLNVTWLIRRGQLCREFRHAASSGFPRLNGMTLEITEQVLVLDLNRAAASLKKLHAQGIRIALDD